MCRKIQKEWKRRNKMEDNRNTAPDIFDRMMGSGFLKRFEPFYKAHKEILLYLLFGGLTTLVGIIFFAIPVKLISLPEVQLFGHKINLTVQVANVISWVCAVMPPAQPYFYPPFRGRLHQWKRKRGIASTQVPFSPIFW